MAIDGETPAQMRARWDAGYADLKVPSDVEPYGKARTAYLRDLNSLRALVGNPPFENDEVDNPELAERRRRANEAYNAERAVIQRERQATRGPSI